MNTPTEPGYYWARFDDGWEPVHFEENWIDIIGSEDSFRAEVAIEWGEKIERKREPQDTTP